MKREQLLIFVLTASFIFYRCATTPADDPRLARRFTAFIAQDQDGAALLVDDDKTGSVSIQASEQFPPGIYLQKADAKRASMAIVPSGIYVKSKGKSFFISLDKLAALGVEKEIEEPN